MVDELAYAQKLALRVVSNPYVNVSDTDSDAHPFDERNIHPELRRTSIELFDNGHFSQATFEACKYLDKRVKAIIGVSKTGEQLMMDAFNDGNPKITLADLETGTGKDIQRGFKFIFSGTIAAIRNPRGHEVNLPDTIDKCLDHLSFVSMLLRRLDEAVGAVV